MAYSTISKPSLHFNTVLYSGDDATTRNITGFGFQPDFVWNKARSAAYNHYLIDAVRGSPGNVMISNLNNAQDNDSGFQNSFKGFVADGNTIGQVGGYEVNDSGVNYVEWGWKANGQGSSNTDGSINTTYTSVNTTAGFSISTWVGTASNSTIGHGLGAVPNVMMVKRIDGASDWIVYHSGNTANPETDFLRLNTDVATQDNNTIWNDTAPTSSVFSVGTEFGNGSLYLTYCFAEKKGYSKFGSYTGNGNTNGPFIYTGFKPAMVISKRIDSTGNWRIRDNKRFDQTNPIDKVLRPNTNQAEVDEDNHDFLSNGFKVRTTGAENNASGGTFIYMAFAAEPLVANVGQSIPATAR